MQPSEGPRFLPSKIYYTSARLRSLKYANFLTYYHLKNTEDPFKIMLTQIIDKHKELTNDPDNFITPIFNAEGFYFKTSTFPKCKNLSGKPCILNDIIDHDVFMKLKIQPYDFIPVNGERVIGVSITLLECTAKKEIY